MSYYQNGNNPVAEIYKTVMQDVINQVKESFLDENIDIDILAQLKKDWEDKVNSSGCVDMEPRQAPMQQHHVAPPPMRQNPTMPGPPRMQVPIPQMARPAPQTVQQLINAGHPAPQVALQMDQRPPQLQMPYLQQVQQASMAQIPIQGNHLGVGVSGLQAVSGLPGGVPFPQGGVRMVQAVGGMPGGQFMQNQPGMMFIQQNGQQIPLSMTGQHLLQPRVQHGLHPMHQLDGNSRQMDSEEEDEGPDTVCSSSQAARPKKRAVKPNWMKDEIRIDLTHTKTKKEAQAAFNALFKQMQLDGGGGGMSDSSSEEEEEDDPLRRIADKIGGDGNEGEEEIVAEEDPLNSEDDQSDDEDLETIFDADNIIMCLFEKVHRARSKWKFQLKDGIMHINNRDFCFQKCTGDAEW